MYLPKCCVNPGWRDILQQTRISNTRTYLSVRTSNWWDIIYTIYWRFSLRFDQSGFRFILEEWRPTTVRQRLSDPSSLTGLHLSISDYSLRNSLLNTLISKGCYRLFKWAMHAGFFVSTWGGRWESNITPHSPGQPKVYSPRKVYMLVKSK